MPKTYNKVSGTWKQNNKIYVKVSGTWKQIKKAYYKTGGVWKQIHSSGPEVSLISVAGNNTPGTSFTLSNVPIGDASTERTLIIASVVSSTSSIINISNITVDGVTATQRVLSANSGGTNYQRAAIYTIPKTTGTTANIVITASHSSTIAGCAVWSCLGLSSEVPTSSNSDITTTSSDTIMNMNITGTSNEIAVGFVYDYKNNTTYSWTGLTETYEGNLVASSSEPGQISAADLAVTSNGTITVTITKTSPGYSAGVVAAFS